MNRRGLISGLGTLLICAPAIVRASSLMSLSIQPRIGISFDPVPTNMLVPMFYPEVDPSFLRQLRVVADLVESHFEETSSE
jgi:hypothetical protein